MSNEQIIFLKMTPKELGEVEKGLRMLDAQRAASRKAAKRRQEALGKPYLENGHRIQPFQLRVMTHADLYIEYEKINALMHTNDNQCVQSECQ